MSEAKYRREDLFSLQFRLQPIIVGKLRQKLEAADHTPAKGREKMHVSVFAVPSLLSQSYTVWGPQGVVLPQVGVFPHLVNVMKIVPPRCVHRPDAPPR